MSKDNMNEKHMSKEAKKKEDRLLIARKLEQVGKLLKEISDIGNTHQWFDTAKADILLDDVNEWLAMLEFQRKVTFYSGIHIDELKQRCKEVKWTPNAKAWLETKSLM